METYNEAEARETAERIECLIDRVGLYDTLSIIADICAEKADHIRVNWQDEPLARDWQIAGECVAACRRTTPVRSLP